MAFGTAVRVKALLANGEVAQFGLRFTRTAEPTFTELLALADEIATVRGADIAALYASDIAAFSIGCQNFTHVTPGGSSAPYWGPSSAEAGNVTVIGPGTHTGSSTMPQVALVASLHTALPGKSHRGRLFGFPPPDDVLDSEGRLTTAYPFETLITTIAADVESSSNISGAVFSVFSAKLDSSDPVLSVTKDNRVDTQRRRLTRR